MSKKRVKRKLLTGACLGLLTGVSITLVDREVRRYVVDKTKRVGRKTFAWIDDVRQDPEAFVNRVKESYEQITKSVQEVNEQFQGIVEQVENIKESSVKMVQTAKDVSEEMKEVGNDLLHVPERDARFIRSNGRNERLH